MKDFIIKDKLLLIFSIISLGVIWKILSIQVGAEILVPPPESVLRSCVALLREPGFLESVFHTILRSILGFSIALVAALVMGITGGTFKTAYILFIPIVSITKATPTMSVILLALIWVHTEIAPVLVGFLVIFPILYGNIVAGIKNVDSNLLQMAKMYRIRKKRIITELYLPSIFSYLIAGASTSLGLNLKVVIAAEVLSQPRMSIGTHLQMEQISLNTAGVFAWTLVAIAISSCFDWGLGRIQKKTDKWL